VKTALALLCLLAVASAADPWWSSDKAVHGVVAFTTPFAIHDCLRACQVSHKAATWTAVGLTAAACLGKEWADSRTKSGWSWRDLTFGAIGLTLSGVAVAKLCR
jgi:uncharacterized protein YfiM (DUF2279 family)